MKRCKECGYNNEDNADTCLICQANLNLPNTGQRLSQISGNFDYPVPYYVSTGTLLKSDQDSAYNVVQFIAEGGFAKVFHARGPKLHLDNVGNVAVKILNLFELHPDQQKEFTKRFDREYPVGLIDSNYIVRTFAKGMVSANPFMVMEYCPNGTLEHRIQGNSLPEKEVKNIAVRILRGLHDLHQAGIVHRDLKPSNILFDELNHPRVADFGISAYIRNRMTQINRKGNLDSTLGTPYYCPPEQRKGTESVRMTNPRMDIYAFGVIIYEALSKGQFPSQHPGENITIDDYYKRAEKGIWKDIRDYQPDLDPRWSEIIGRCIAARPDQRFESVSEILDLFGYKAESEPPVAERTDAASNQPRKLLLRVINGEEIDHTYRLNDLIQKKGGVSLTLGWFDAANPHTNDIGIAEKYTQYISSHHATVECIKRDGEDSWYIRDGQWYVKDQHNGWHRSKNGVLINSLEADDCGHQIFPNDIITIGDTKMKVETYNA